MVVNANPFIWMGAFAGKKVANCGHMTTEYSTCHKGELLSGVHYAVTRRGGGGGTTIHDGQCALQAIKHPFYGCHKCSHQMIDCKLRSICIYIE